MDVANNPIYKFKRMKKTVIIVGFTLSIIIVVIALNPKKSFILSMILGGKIVAPEASAILTHYCFGNGDTLFLKPDYFKKSPVVKKAITEMRTGENKIVWVKQQDDWRLSYALNGFHILKKKDSYLVYQRIAFDTTGKVHTILNLGFTNIKVPDNIVHTFDCKPFVAVCKMIIH